MKQLKYKKEFLRLLSVLFDYQNSGKGDIFFRLSGHVAWAEIDVHVGPWGGEPEIIETVTNSKSIEKLIERIKVLSEELPNQFVIEERRKDAKDKKEREEYERLRAKFETKTK